jgi:hypothetical protein
MISRLKKFRTASSFPIAAIILAAALTLSPAGARATTATEAGKATEVSQPQEHPESALLNRVMLTILGVWAALAVYLFFIDRKLSRMERERE